MLNSTCLYFLVFYIIFYNSFSLNHLLSYSLLRNSSTLLMSEILLLLKG